MSIVTEAEQLTEAVAPQLRVSRWVFYAILAVAIAILLGLAFWWLIIRPNQLATTVATSHVEAIQSNATAGAAQDTLKLQVIHDHEIMRIDATTQENQDAIHQASGADTSSPGVADVLRRSVCLRASHSADPACAALRRSGNSVGTAGADAGGTPPGK